MQRLTLNSKLGSLGSLALCSLALACSEGAGVGDGSGGDSSDSGGSSGSSAASGGSTASSGGDSGSGGADADLIVPVTLLDIESVLAMSPGVAATPPRVSLNDDQETVIEVDDSEGFEDNSPALRFDVPFTDYNQYVEYDFTLPATMDLEGGALLLPVRFGGGASTDLSCPSGIKFYAKTGASFAYGELAWTNTPAAGGWLELFFDLSAAVGTPAGSTFEPNQVAIIGVSFDTGDCGGAFAASPSVPVPATYFIDNVRFVPDAAAYQAQLLGQ